MAGFPRKTAALIGAGMVAKTHLAALADSQCANLACVVARSPEKAMGLLSEMTAHYPKGAPVVHMVDAVADTSIDFAIVLTPPDARAEIIRPLAEAGKHILLEKPMGRNAQEAREVVEICEAAGVSLGVVLQHRMRESAQAARDLIESGALGALGVVEIAVPWWRDQSYYDEPGRGTYARDGGGVLISQAIHTLDLALSLAGPVETVQAMASTTRFHAMEAEDFVTAGLRFKGGAVGSIVASTASYPGGAESIRLHFEKGSLTLEGGALDLHWRDGRHEVIGAAAGTGGGADPMAFTHDWHQAVIDDFAASLDAGRAPAITGRDALAVHDLIDAIVESAAQNTPIEVNS